MNANLSKICLYYQLTLKNKGLPGANPLPAILTRDPYDPDPATLVTR